MKKSQMSAASKTALFLMVGILISGVASAQVAKVDICHKKGKKGTYVLKRFTQNAISAHLKHGDGFPGDPYPGLEGAVFSADCSPEIASSVPLCGYDVLTSIPLNYPDGGWGWWSVQGAKIVTGGGFELTGGPAAVSAPVTPESTWAGYTFRVYEYGWVVRDAEDGFSSPDSTVYAICADRCP